MYKVNIFIEYVLTHMYLLSFISVPGMTGFVAINVGIHVNNI